MKDPFEPIPAAAMIWMAAPQSMDAIEAMDPMVLASVKQEFDCAIAIQRKEGRRTANDPGEEVAPLGRGIRVGPKIELGPCSTEGSTRRDAVGLKQDMTYTA